MQPDRGEIGVKCDCCASGGEVLDPADIEEVYMPLENVKKCGGCGKGGERLRICSSCGEVSVVNTLDLLPSESLTACRSLTAALSVRKRIGRCTNANAVRSM
jgi:hypothetical protein